MLQAVPNNRRARQKEPEKEMEKKKKHRMRRHPFRSRKILPVSGPVVIGWAGIGDDAYTAVESYP